MKKIIPLIVCLLVFYVFLFPVSLIAEGAPIHVGTQNSFKIGQSPEAPVLVTEYATFLQQRAADKPYLFYSDYFDVTFMIGSWTMRSGNKSVIYVSGWTPWNPYSTFSVIPGYEHNIIDGLTSQQVQQEFNAWRKNQDKS